MTKNEEKEKVSIEALYRNMGIIWMALFSTQFIFVIIALVVKPELRRFDFSNPILGELGLIIIVFAFAGIINLIISFALKKKFLAQAINEQNPHFVQTAMIVGCALCEVVSLLGMMLAFVAGYQYFFLWMILGAFGMIFHFPTRDALIAASSKN